MESNEDMDSSENRDNSDGMNTSVEEENIREKKFTLVKRNVIRPLKSG